MKKLFQLTLIISPWIAIILAVAGFFTWRWHVAQVYTAFQQGQIHTTNGLADYLKQSLEHKGEVVFEDNRGESNKKTYILIEKTAN